jgi:hypothetical protein
MSSAVILTRAVLLAAILSVATGAAMLRAQPVEWTVESGGNGHRYDYKISSVTWGEAATRAANECCIPGNSYLVSIGCQAENDFVAALLRQRGAERAWIGYEDAGTEGRFEWISQEDYSYSNWGFGEPNNDGGDENYAEIYADGLWNDTPDLEQVGWVVESGPRILEWPRSAGGNGHFYQGVQMDTNVTWSAARSAAQGAGFCGLRGHLITVASAAENNFAARRAWIGLSRTPPSRAFRWVTGEPLSFENWAPGEPNNLFGNVDVVEILADGTWNDNSDSPTPGVSRYTIEYGPPAFAGTVFRYSFADSRPLPRVSDQSPARNDATAGPSAVLSANVPPSRPTGGGNRSLDCRTNGAVTDDKLLLSNAAIDFDRGFTMEAWFQWNGGGFVNSIIDYAGTEKLVIDVPSGGAPTVTMRFSPTFNSTTDYPIGPAVPGRWQYVAVVFQAAPRNPDGTLTGTLTTYLDCLTPSSVVPGVTKGNFGDSLVRGIGVGQHPLSFPQDFFDGLIYEPRVSVRALNPTQLLLQDPPCSSSGEGPFIRCDANCSGAVDISDSVHTLSFLFLGGGPPCCPAAGNCNGDGAVDISDATYGLNFLFLGGPPPLAPFPACGSGGCPAHPCP